MHFLCHVAISVENVLDTLRLQNLPMLLIESQEPPTKMRVFKGQQPQIPIRKKYMLVMHCGRQASLKLKNCIEHIIFVRL